MQIYKHIPHPRTTLHLAGRAPKPPKVDDGRVGLNGKIGLLITTLVGTMIARAATVGPVSGTAGTDGATGTAGA